MQVDEFLRTQTSTNRLRSDYLRHARSAFRACEAVNLVRAIDERSSASESRSGQLLDNRPVSSLSSMKSIISPSVSGRLLGDADGNSNSRSSAGRDSAHAPGKLELEEILRSFLILASEKNSDGLIRRVLQVLLQVTCTHYACFATQDSVTGSVQLKGYGTYENIQTCHMSLAVANGLAPTVLLSHVSITKRVSDRVKDRRTRATSLISGQYRL